MNLFIFGLAVLATLNSVSASEIGISYSKTNDLILSGSTCQELITQHEAICSWRQTNEPEFVKPVITAKSCRKNQNGKYSMTVSACLPVFVKANQNKKNYHSGANCWGTAMSFKKHSIRPRFIWSNEMKYWLDSPLCRKLAHGEKKEPGDILNIFGPEHVFNEDETVNKGYHFWEALYPGRVTASPVPYGYSGYHNFLHSETYISDKITFGKDSPNNLDKFEFNPINEVYGRPREVECQENQLMTPHNREYQNSPKPIRGSKCAYFSLAYRCESFPGYFAKQELNETEKGILADINRLQAVQDKLFPLLTTAGTQFSKGQIEEMLKLSDNTSQQTLKELEVRSFSKNHEMLLVLKYFTATGIRKSLELAELTPPTEQL